MPITLTSLFEKLPSFSSYFLCFLILMAWSKSLDSGIPQDSRGLLCDCHSSIFNWIQQHFRDCLSSPSLMSLAHSHNIRNPFLLDSTGFYWILPDSTGFSWIILHVMLSDMFKYSRCLKTFIQHPLLFQNKSMEYLLTILSVNLGNHLWFFKDPLIILWSFFNHSLIIL